MNMWSTSRTTTKEKTSMLLWAILLLYCQISHVGAANDTYIAEVTIDGNATLDVSSFLSELQFLAIDSVTIIEAIIIAQCEIVGDTTTCSCENDYIFSNLVCDSFSSCCNAITCVANVSDFEPLCVPKVNVTLDGTIDTTLQIPVMESALLSQFQQLNGFDSLNVTQRDSDGLNFIVNLISIFETPKVQAILSEIMSNYSEVSNINVTSTGLANISIPSQKVCYNSQLTINCNTEEQMETCMWQVTQPGQGQQIVGLGTEVDIPPSPSCTTSTAIKLKNITSIWAGTYTCLFTKGLVSHAASGNLQVALLPEIVNFTSVPQNPDCSIGQSTTVNVTCSYYTSAEPYTVYLNGTATVSVYNNITSYSKSFPVPCTGAQPPSLTFVCNITNSLGQNRTAVMNTPVIYPGDPVCEEDDPWPKVKNGSIALVLCTDPGRLGIRQRQCTGTSWETPIELCIKAEVNQLTATAGDFEKGVGATLDGANAIFDNLKNNTVSGNTYGDIMATVQVFSTMSRASNKITLDETLLPNFIESASNILNSSWNTDNSSADLASNYLSSVESLVKNIWLNTSDGHNSSMIQLQVCRKSSVCNRTVFNVDVEVNSSAFEVKTLGIQNIAELLPAGAFKNYVFPSLVVSATVNGSGPVSIRMAFPVPDEDKPYSNHHCVFWNTTDEQWSEDGCNYTRSSGNISYCECSHLTSFSMLLSKTPVNLPFMDQITYIGLGISICSLVVFLLIEGLVWNAVVKSNLSHFRHTALVNISLSLLLADCSFVAATFENVLTDTLCLIVALAQHFFYLAMFFWMLCLSIMLLHQLIFVFHPLRKKVYMILSITIGYACPTVTVGATYLYYNKRTDVGYYSRASCWLTYEGTLKGSLYAFLFPLGTIVFINMFSMVVVIVTLLRPAAAESNKKDDKEAAKSIIKVIIFLTPVFGGTWILGLFVFLMSGDSVINVIIHYAFTIVNSLQGFFILLTGCFGEKRVRDEIIKLVISRSAKSDSKRNLTSSAAKK